MKKYLEIEFDKELASMILGTSKNFTFEIEFVVDDFSDVKSLLSTHSQKWHFSAWHKINLLPYGDIFVLSFRNSPFSETWIKEITSKTKAEELKKWLH